MESTAVVDARACCALGCWPWHTHTHTHNSVRLASTLVAPTCCCVLLAFMQPLLGPVACPVRADVSAWHAHSYCIWPNPTCCALTTSRHVVLNPAPRPLSTPKALIAAVAGWLMWRRRRHRQAAAAAGSQRKLLQDEEQQLQHHAQQQQFGDGAGTGQPGKAHLAGHYLAGSMQQHQHGYDTHHGGAGSSSLGSTASPGGDRMGAAAAAVADGGPGVPAGLLGSFAGQ